MSRMKSEEEYRKTKAFHFFRWLSGGEGSLYWEFGDEATERIYEGGGFDSG